MFYEYGDTLMTTRNDAARNDAAGAVRALAETFNDETGIALRHRRTLGAVAAALEAPVPPANDDVARDLRKLEQGLHTDLKMHAAAALGFAPADFVEEERAAAKSHAKLAAGVNGILRRHF